MIRRIWLHRDEFTYYCDFAEQYSLREDVASEYLNLYKKMVLMLPMGSEVDLLDFGCNTGTHLQMIQKEYSYEHRGFNNTALGKITGVDNNDTALIRARARTNFDYYTYLSVQTGKHNIFIAANVLDSLNDRQLDGNYLRQLDYVLADGGYGGIIVNNAWKGRLFGWVDRLKGVQYDKNICSEYTKKEMIKMLDDYGYETVVSDYIGWRSFPYCPAWLYGKFYLIFRRKTVHSKKGAYHDKSREKVV